MKPKVYIDGKEGTTGLQIYDRLASRDDIELLLIDEDKRKDTAERKKLINAADLVFLCLPDAAAIEAVSLIENPDTRVIDASTAHRTADGWVYGFAELLVGQRQRIKEAKRVANPGCHATGFLAGTAPLSELNVRPADYPVTCYSLTGYSGGGKKLIAEYEAEDRSVLLDAPAPYAIGLTHKHLPEMQKLCGLSQPPVFSPILGDFYEGMATTVLLPGFDAARIWECLSKHYEGQKLVSVAPLGGDESVIYADTLAGKDSMRLIVCGHEKQTTVTALFDNLGKGASGAAIQNMNILLGVDETTGLVV